MVNAVEHIRAPEFAPLHIMEVEAPDDGHDDGCKRSNPMSSFKLQGNEDQPWVSEERFKC